MIPTPIYDQCLAEFKAGHHGRAPGETPTASVRIAMTADAFKEVGRAAVKATDQMTASMTVMKEARKRASKPRDPRITTTGRRRQ